MDKDREAFEESFADLLEYCGNYKLRRVLQSQKNIMWMDYIEKSVYNYGWDVTVYWDICPWIEHGQKKNKCENIDSPHGVCCKQDCPIQR